MKGEDGKIDWTQVAHSFDVFCCTDKSDSRSAAGLSKIRLKRVSGFSSCMLFDSLDPESLDKGYMRKRDKRTEVINGRALHHDSHSCIIHPFRRVSKPNSIPA